MFQSAPHLSSEANPVAVPSTPAGPLFQSAPHFSSEANLSPGSSGVKDRVVSIRASLQQRGEPPYPAPLLRLQQRFNPRLTSAARRTHLCSNTHAAYVVSIRASLQQRGELYKYW